MLAALVELLFFFPPFFPLFYSPPVDFLSAANVAPPSRSLLARRNTETFAVVVVDVDVIGVPNSTTLLSFYRSNATFSSIQARIFRLSTISSSSTRRRKKEKSTLSFVISIYIYIYIYSKDTDGNPASREPFLNEGRGLFGFSRVRMDRLEFKGCARRSPIGVAPTGARLIATHAPLLLRL